jgi:flagellar hook-basal body complex protein FliE
MPISPIRMPQVPQAAPQPARPANQTGFDSVLQTAIEHVEKSSGAAKTSIQQFLGGESEELHNTVLATQKAELQFELFLQVRNKVVSAYQEIMKMQV